MTCVHVLDLIDAGPFAGYPPEHIAEALEHARGCTTCGPALAASTALVGDLASLAEIAAPPDLETSVMARIARLEDLPVAAEAAGRAWTPWALTLGAAVAAVAFVVGLATARRMLAVSPEALAIALSIGLVVYASGLFAPLRDRQGPGHETSS